MAAMIRPLLAAAAVFAIVAAACASDDSDHSLSRSPDVTAPSAQTCSPARPRAVGDAPWTLGSGGGQREYLLHVPAPYDGTAAVPLVLALHGRGSTPEDVRALSRLDEAAGARGMIAVYPRGSGEGADAGWNAESFSAGPADSRFLSDLLDELRAVLCIDATRVYLAGFSQGGAMALRFACDAPDRVAAVAPVAAPYVACQAAVPLIAFHGSEDPLVPYEGGISPLDGRPAPPVHRAASEWARALGCDALPTISRAAADVEVATYGNCRSGGADAQLYNGIGGGHTWPGTPVEAPEGLAGATIRSISATDLMLDFFADARR
jgi:polyhydroxybutyrate depolymerase